MTILVHAFRSWAAAQPVHRPERTFSACTPRALKPLSAPRYPRLEMRWHLDANGRLTCTWQLVSDTAPARSDDKEAKPPPWRWARVRTEDHQTYAKRQ
jgi:hypothetical protein